MREVIREIFPHELERFGSAFPHGVEYRKHWEVAMAVRALRAGGTLHPAAEFLGVGAGNEPTVFFLTRHARRVFATDLYLQGGKWEESANASMLVEPTRHWPSDWNPRRLVVQHMNALDLRYEDASFNGIFSSSSVEHFGDLKDVRRSMAEMFRVLQPGGVLSLSTEFRISGPPPGLPGILMFSREDLLDVLVGDLAWEPMSPLELELSPATARSEQPYQSAAADLRKHVAQHGRIVFHRLDWSRYPHIVLREGDRAWTSVHLALRKRDRES